MFLLAKYLTPKQQVIYRNSCINVRAKANKQTKFKSGSRARKAAQWAKAFSPRPEHLDLTPELSPRDPQGRRRWWTPESCILTSTHTQMHTPTYAHINYAHIKYNFLKIQKPFRIVVQCFTERI